MPSHSSYPFKMATDTSLYTAVVIIVTVPPGTTVYEFLSSTITVSPQAGVTGEESTMTSTNLPASITVSTAAPQFPLTTTFIPPTSCFNRFYLGLESRTNTLFSGALDPLFESCQAIAGQLTYSPGMCPGLMKTEVRAFGGSQFTEICCQR